jgi:RNA-directed DNA polymerase
MSNRSLPIALATAFLAGEASVDGVAARAAITIGKDLRWMRPLARRYIRSFVGKVRPRHRDVVQFLLHDAVFQRHSQRLSVMHWLTEPARMQPAAAAVRWEIPAIESVGELCDWLQIELGELEWFADLRGLGYRQSRSRLQHYHYKVLAKRSGDLRLIEAPKQRLKEMQRRILAEILERIPVHSAVHGFRRGRSIKSFVSPHVGQRVVVRMDVRDFFPSFHGPRIQAFFRTAGYPESVADLLGGICTNAVPGSVWDKSYFDFSFEQLREARALYARSHLPQGAPTSPMLANLCAYRMDCRLRGLAASAGAEYTRYADDLAFSGDEAFSRHAQRFSEHAAAVLLEEGFHVHHRKTRIMRSGRRQYLGGLVTNEKVNVMRRDFDLLKAILTNCIRSGPESQNREQHPSFREHLEGRISFVTMIHAGKGARLRRLFEQIQW